MVWLHPLMHLRNIKRRIFKKKFDYFWITLDFIPEELPSPPPPLIQRILGLVKLPPFNLFNLHKLLTRLGKEIQFKGIIIDLRLYSIPLARFQSLVEILKEFRDKSKKEIIIFSNMYSLSTYWYATQIATAGHLFLLKTGTIDTRGLRFETVFLGETLEKYGFKFEKYAVSGYKSAGDELTRVDFTPESRENRKWLLEDLFNQMAFDIAKARNISHETVLRLMNQSPWDDTVSVNQNWVDKVILPDELPEILGLLDSSNSKPARIIPFSYVHKVLLLQSPPKLNKTIAIITAAGGIIDGKSQSSPVPIPIPIPFFSEEQLGDDTLNQVIRRAMSASYIKGVVLYVDSPGGSVTASESIRGALKSLASKKPLKIYMGNVAASGGYYISMPGKKIISQPGTITGSIGVLGGKLSMKKAFENVQAHPQIVTLGERADWDSVSKSLSSEESLIKEKSIEHLYRYFLELVTTSRKIDSIKLREELAGGRVWTGKQALEHHLIDDIGSLQKAVHYAQEEAKLDKKAPTIILYPHGNYIPPRSITPQEYIEQFLGFINAWTQIKHWAVLDPLPIIKDA